MTRAMLLVLLAGCGKAPEVDPAASILVDDFKRHQTVLASDEFEGREAGSEGGRKASDYLASEARRIGLRPGGVDGTYFQPFGERRRNVVAVLEGKVAEYVVVGAHYDHVGRGEKKSLGGKVGEIHNGADDNASGTSVGIEVAEAMALRPPRRTVVFLWFDGEEDSLAGSKHWTGSPTRPLSGCMAMLNCDMVGRNETEKIVVGVEKVDGKAKYPRWEAVIRAEEARAKATFDWSSFDSYLKRSDHWPFMEQGVPALFFTGGIHADYHRESDDVEKINWEKEVRVARIVYGIARAVADGEGRLKD